MSRSLSLNEVHLGLPKAWALDGLPPPFGTRRRNARAATEGAPQRAAQQAIELASQPRTPPARPPLRRFIFHCPLPRKPDPSDLFAAQLAEAKRYLEMGAARPQSSRSDHILAAAIFVTCSIALSWLLVTGSTRNHEGAVAIAIGHTPQAQAYSYSQSQPQSLAKPQAQPQPRAPSQPQSDRQPAPPTSAAPTSLLMQTAAAYLPRPIRADAQAKPTLAHQPQKNPARRIPRIDRPQRIVATRSPVLSWVSKVEEATPMQHMLQHHRATDDRQAANFAPEAHPPAGRVTPSHASGVSRIEERIPLSQPRSLTTKAEPGRARQPAERAPRATASETNAEKAALLAWAAEQRRASTTPRADNSALSNTDWTSRITQRRVTDNPNAFAVRRDAK